MVRDVLERALAYIEELHLAEVAFGDVEILELPWYHPTLSEVMLNLARDVVAQRA